MTQTKKKKLPTAYLVAAAVAVAGIVALCCYYLLGSLSTHDDVQYVYIDADDNIDSVFAKLQPISCGAGMTALRTVARHTSYSEHIHTGRYAVRPGEGALSVYQMLSRGEQEPMRLTVPEARTMPRMAALLAKKLMMDSATIANALTDNGFCQKYGQDTATMACLFIPNTYDIYWDVSIDGLMKRMKREHDNFWTAARRSKAEAAGLTPDEVQTLASIVDEETANNEEKPKVAGMYLNRVRKHMLLQADPTVKFALKQFDLRRILNVHLKVESPYNTYLHVGLPPGPIKVASVKGIDAVLNHVPSDYLYMCAKEDFSGTHNFARTYSEHLANARRYQQALNARGIK